MRHIGISRPAALLLAAVIAGSALTGCSDASDENTPAAEPAPTASVEETAAPAATARLVQERTGGSIGCVSEVENNTRFTFYQPIAKADGDVTITAAQAVGKDVKLTDSQGVLVVANKRRGVGAYSGSAWPIPDSDGLKNKTDPASRQKLVGMRLTDGQRVLPLLGVRVTPGSILQGIKLDYSDQDHNSSSVVLEMNTRFVGTRC